MEAEDQKLKEEILESITDAFFAVDKSWNFTYLNKEAERVLQVKREDILGENLWVHFPEAKQLIFFSEYNRVMEGRVSTKFKEYYPPLQAWFKVSAYPAKEGLAVYFQNITQEKNLEMEAEKSEKNLLALINNTDDFIWSVDNELKLISANLSFLKAVKLRSGKDIQKGDEVYIFAIEEKRREEWKKHYQRALHGEHFRIIEHVVNPEGKERYTEISFNPISSKEQVIGVSCFARDITIKKQAEEEIRKAKEQLESMLERITEGFVSLNKDGNYTYVNEKAAQLLERDRNTLIGKNIWLEFPELINCEFSKKYHQAIATQQAVSIETHIQALQRWYEGHFYPSAEGMSVFFRDITENKSLENKLKLSEEKYRILFSENPIPLWMCEYNTLTFIEVNQAAIKKYGVSRKMLLSKSLLDVCLAEDVPKLQQAINTIKKGKYTRIQTRYRKKDGSLLYIVLILSSIAYHDKKVILATSNDITELKKAELALISSALEGEDRERKRIAKELHDGLGQNLTAALLNLNTINSAVATLDNRKHQQFLTGLSFLNQAIEESRRIANNLMPKTIEDFGLVSSLQSLVGNIQKSSQVTIFFYTNLTDERYTRPIELNLYRIAQELLQNTLKHAQASKISLQLIKHRREIVFTYEDNGKGFDMDNSALISTGLGLSNISNRVFLLKGHMHMSSKPGKGMAATIAIPVF